MGMKSLVHPTHVGISAGSAVQELDSMSTSEVPQTMAKGLISVAFPLMDLAHRDVLDLERLLIPQS